MLDFTHLSARNAEFGKRYVVVANGETFVALDLTADQISSARGVIYLHVHKATRRCYVGITEQTARSRWISGIAYRNNRRFGSALKKYSWNGFESYVLAFGDDRQGLNEAEVQAIRAAGGHKSSFTFNLSPGGDLVAENDKPIVGINLQTGASTRFKSGAEAARILGFANVDKAMAVVRGERTSAAGWWFRLEEDTLSKPPSSWGESLRTEAVRRKQGKAVVAIHLTTRERREFETTSEAAAQLGMEQSQVSSVARRRSLSAGGWWFCFSGDDETPPEVTGSEATRAKRDRAVVAVNLKTAERRVFRNCTEASSELGLYSGAAASVASGTRTSAGDWWFSYDLAGNAPALTKGALVAVARSKAVVATFVEGGQQTRFESAKQAAEALGMSRAAISKCLSGNGRPVKGFRFSWG